MRIYQAADGRWILWTGIEKIYFDTQREARSYMTKLSTAIALVDFIKQLAALMDAGPDVYQEYWDIVSGQGAYTDEDLEALGITAAQLTSAVVTIEAVNVLMAGDPAGPVIAEYHQTVNMIRRVDTG